MSERDELVELIRLTGLVDDSAATEMADTLRSAGYRKAEPVWEPGLLNDGVYEYTQTGSCDGSIVYNYRRLPRLQYVGEHPSWESYEPEPAP